MNNTRAMDWYDHPEEYDILCSWDPAAERDFVLGASERWGVRGPRRLLEPFCGPGRLLRHMPGFAVGLDINPRMLRHARRDCRVFRADAASFAVKEASFDLAFCLIDSFRYLLTEEAAFGHLRAVARALRPGSVYVLGFDIAGDLGGDVSGEEWSMERDGVRVDGRVRGLGDADPDTRIETFHSVIDVARGGETERIETFAPMRVYAHRDVEDLIDSEGSFEIAGVFDRHYDLERPVELSEIAGSAVLVLAR